MPTKLVPILASLTLGIGSYSQTTQKTMVVDLLKSIETGDLPPFHT